MLDSFLGSDQRKRRLLLAGGLLGLLMIGVAAVVLAQVLSDADRDVLSESRSVLVVDGAPVTIDVEGPDARAVQSRDVTVTREPAEGEVAINPDGSLTYSPGAEFEGRDRFTYRVEGAESGPVLEVGVTVERPPGLTSSVEALEFGEVCLDCSETSEVELVPESDDVAIEEVRVLGEDSGQFRLDQGCDTGPGASGGECTIRVSFTPAEARDITARLEVLHTGDVGRLVIPLTGAGACDRPGEEQLALLDEVVGFGDGATGGAAGCLYHVTSLDDSGEGSLREAAGLDEPAWIVFDVSGVIQLEDEIALRDDKTIDGRGQSITLEGSGLLVVDTQNVIVTDIEVRGSDQDGFQIRGPRTRDIWVHHVQVWDIEDGYIDITQGATDVTVSWCRFIPSEDRERDKTLLVGTGEPGFDDENSRVTLHHNLFDGTQQRNPLIRVGSVHSFNNYFDGWGLYASGVDAGGRLLSEANVYAYDGAHRDRAFVLWGEGPAYIRSINDTLLEGASGEESDPDAVPDPPYEYEAEEADDDLAERIRDRAGPRG